MFYSSLFLFGYAMTLGKLLSLCMSCYINSSSQELISILLLKYESCEECSFYFILFYSYFTCLCRRHLQLTEMRTQLPYTFSILIKMLIGTDASSYLTFSISK